MSLLKKRNDFSTRPVAPQTSAGHAPSQSGELMPMSDGRLHGLVAKTGSTLRSDSNIALGTSTLPDGIVLQGRYMVETVQGIGGMSIVYRGRDLRFRDVNRPCAIKEMQQNAPESHTRLLKFKNFEREASLLATFSHPAIPKVYDFFEENGRAYLVMEFIEGQDLMSVLDTTHGQLDELRVARWALEICDVLDFLHSHQPDPIIFRDLKPSNVIVTPQDRIVLVDFGIARIFDVNQQRGTIIGTEGYAPPEQYRGVYNAAGDIYALGATLHHLLTGIDPRLETPFTFHERPIRMLNPAVSPELELAVTRALEYEPSARPASALEMKALLLATPGLEALGTTTPGRPTIKMAASQPIPSGAQLLWSFKSGDEVRSSPCARDGMLYIGSYDTNLYSLDSDTGALRWKRATMRGVSSSPAIWGDLVVVGSEDGQIYALDARRGNVRWTIRTERAVRSSPRVSDRVIYVGSDDQHVYAIDGLNGRQLWKYRTWMAVRSSCAVGDEAVYIGSSDGHVYAIDPLKGTLRWKFRTHKEIISTPVIADGLVYFGSMDGNVYAIDSDAGSQVWRYKTGHYVNSSPVVEGKTVYVGGVDGHMYAIDTISGKPIWKYDTGAQITSSPRLGGGFVYFGAVNGNLYKLDAASGELVWKYTTGGPVVSSPLVQGDKVFFGSLDHNVYALEA